ncbi:MAG: hypothetical protein AB7S75_04500 [Desulfococcaceae bacterium]
MKQKYMIVRDDEKNSLILREFAELDKDILSLLCEQVYDRNAVLAALGESDDALIALLRTKNLFPPASYMEKIVKAVSEVYGPEGPASAEAVFDDSQLLTVTAAVIPDDLEALTVIEEDSSDIDELLEEDALEDDFVGEETISNIASNSSIKIADDEALDIEDET